MNKTVTINLSGQVFQIDEDAYERLKAYLDSIHVRFAGTEGADEIIADIEARLAEMFLATIGDKKGIITLADVEGMIVVMGRPEDFGDVDDEEPTANTGAQASAKQTVPGTGTRKRLYRDPDDKMLGGVLSGISAYFGINDPVWLRLATVVLGVISLGLVVFFYIAMWVVIPKAVTASEKLEMRGEPINIDNIERTIREDIDDIKNRINKMDTHSNRVRVRSVFERVGHLVMDILKGILGVITRLLGVAIVLGSLAIMIALTWGYIFSGQDFGQAMHVLPHYFNSQALVVLAIISFILVIFIPLFGLLLWGFRLLFHGRFRGHGLGISFGWLFTLGVILAFVCITYHVRDVSTGGEKNIRIPVKLPENKTLRISLLDDKQNGETYNGFLHLGPLRIANDSIYMKGNTARESVAFVRLNIKKSDRNECYLEEVAFARGVSSNDAREKASHITYHYQLDDSTLQLGSYLSFPKRDMIRSQMVVLNLYLPEGAKVQLDQNTCTILAGLDNTNDYYSYIMAGHTWTMGTEKLTCEGCEDKSKTAMQLFGNGKEITTGNIDRVEIDGIFEVHLHKGDKSSVKLYGPTDVTENVDVHTNGSTLNISYNKHWLKELMNLRKDYKIYVEVTSPMLESITANGATEVILKGFKGEELMVELNGASHAELDVVVDQLKVEGSGACDVTLTGKAQKLNAEINGAGKLNAFGLETVDAKIEVSGASHAYVKVSGKLDAEANGASKIEYDGSPNISSDASGFSSIKPKR